MQKGWGTGGNTGNDHYPPPRGIRHSREFVDAEEGVRIRLEKMSDGSVPDHMRRGDRRASLRSWRWRRKEGG